MAPQQNTFAVIPAVPGRVGGAPSKPPMTSKQAQKLYKQANKEPRRSKAEQRKWEKEKQEEIRKELEKERAAAKARAARERKKAKEEEARKNRQRAGQPLIDCRPSQDTISRFIRGNGTSRKRDSSGEPIPKGEDTPTSSLGDKPKPKPSPATSAARAAPSVSSPQTAPIGLTKPPATSMAPPPRPSQKPKTANNSSQSLSDPPNQPPYCDIPSPMQPSKGGPGVLPAGLSKTADSSNRVPDKTSAVPVSMGPPLRPPLKPKSKPFMMPRVALPVQQPPRHKVFKYNPPSDPTPVPSVLRLPLQQELPLPNPTPQRESSRIPPPQVPSQKPPPKSTVPMPSFTSPSQRSTSQRLPVETPALPRLQPQAPPPSTQAIVQDCFDDFFPTASQLAMELEQDSYSDTQQEEVSHQQSNDPVTAKVAHGGPAVRSRGIGNAGEQNQASDNGYRKPDNSTYGSMTTCHSPSLKASSIHPNPLTLARGFTRFQASTKTHNKLQGLKHGTQDQEKQSQPPRWVDNNKARRFTGNQ
ncbi:hypothetical protein LX36DRAFT_653376 [Colletotrichum falcatum]|nr:hypothetical protein LX36DRAFT_653376 [Colletotrichum falcatum]